MKHFLDIADFTVKQLNSIIKTAKQIKKSPKQFTNRCKGKTLGMIFEKDSTRTRVSFNVGFQKLGGHVVELKSNEIGFGKRESYEDVLQTLSQFIDCLMIRNDDHRIIRRLSSLNALPIINGLSNYSHPCQILSDLFTINESIGGIKNKQIAWIGDYNNVLRSLIQLQNLYQFKLNIVMPKEILKQNKSKIIKSINKNLMITDKIKDMRSDFEEIYSELENKEDVYFEEHLNERKALNEKIRKRLSVYDLLKETAETIRTQTYADMRTVFDELQKKHYYG